MKTIIDTETQQINFLDERFYRFAIDELQDGVLNNSIPQEKYVYYPSVNYIMGIGAPKNQELLKWIKKKGLDADKEMEEAGTAGSHVHNAISDILTMLQQNKGELPLYVEEKIGEKIIKNTELYTAEELAGIFRFIDFMKLYKPEIIAFERIVKNDAKKYAGTLDLICKIDGKIWLIDYKFSKSIWESNFIQIVAYNAAWNEEHPKMKIDNLGILHLKAQTRGPFKGKIQGAGWKLISFKDFYKADNEKYNNKFTVDYVTKRFYRYVDEFYDLIPNPRPKNLIYPATITLDFLKNELSSEVENGKTK